MTIVNLDKQAKFCACDAEKWGKTKKIENGSPFT